MSNRIFVGNIPFDATEQELRDLFKQAGNITQVVIPKDRETGKPRGFAFVEFENSSQMMDSISKLNNAMMRDRKIIVSEAKKKEPGSGPPRPRMQSSMPEPSVKWEPEEAPQPREKKYKKEVDFDDAAKAKKRMMAELEEKRSKVIVKDKGGKFMGLEDEEDGGEDDFIPVYMKAPKDEE